MKKALITSLLVATLSLSFIGCSSKTDDSQVNTEPVKKGVSVEVLSATRNGIEDVYKFSGKVEPKETVSVVSTIPGKVAKVNYKVGDKVSKGSLLFTMDTTDIYNNINVLKASLVSVEAQIQSAQTGLDTVNGASMQTQIQSAKSALDAAELNYNNNKTTYENNEALFNAGIISKADFDRIELAFKNAELQYNQAQEQYNLISVQMPEENLRKAQDAYNLAVSSKASIEAQIKSAEKSLNDAKVTSPISGVVSACNVVEGTVASQSMAAFTIMDTSSFNVSVEVSEAIINSIFLGDVVNLTITALPDSVFQGVVKTISPAANPTGTYTVEVEIPNNDDTLKVGMFGEVSFVNQKSDSTFVVSRDAVITKDGETYVYIVENNKAKKVNVQTGIDNGQEIEITSGIVDGMDIVVKGQTYITDGTDVEVVSSEKGE